MASISFDTSLNLPTLISIVGGLITGVVFVMSMKADIKTQGAQLAQMTKEVDELRTVQLRLAATSQAHEQDLQQVKAVVNTPKSTNKHSQFRTVGTLNGFPVLVDKKK